MKQVEADMVNGVYSVSWYGSDTVIVDEYEFYDSLLTGYVRFDTGQVMSLGNDLTIGSLLSDELYDKIKDEYGINENL